MTVAQAVFWLALGFCLYVYIGYPAVLLVLSRVRPRRVRRVDHWPSVSLIIPAHNEEEVIEAKVQNALALRYPKGRLEILVVSDGSSDRTDEIVRSCADGSLRLLRLPRRGKAYALNAGARRARGEILVFSDADVLLHADSLRWLVRNFADPEVGGVCGRRCQRGRGAGATAGGEGLYHSYDRWQTAMESRVGSIASAHGALYGIRRRLYVPIADPAQADDLALSARVPLRGYRMVYEPLALSFQDIPTAGRREFRRKIRVTNHTARAILLLGGRALAAHPFYAFGLISHKLLRYLVPFCLIALFLSAAALARSHSWYAAALALQVVFYAAAAAGSLLRTGSLGRLPLLTIPCYFVLVNGAALLGVISILRGTRLGAWTPGGGLAPTTQTGRIASRPGATMTSASS